MKKNVDYWWQGVIVKRMKIEMYIGIEFDQAGKRIDKDFAALAIVVAKEKLIQLYGGVSLSYVNGSYQHNNGTIATEKAVKLEIACVESDSWQDVAQELKEKLNQESVLVNVIPCESIFI